MSNSKISLTLEVKSGNSTKAVNDLGHALNNTANSATSLANNIGEVAGYQEAHIQVSNNETKAIQQAQAIFKNTQTTLSQTKYKYAELNKAVKGYSLAQSQTKLYANESMHANKQQAKSTDDLAKAEQNLTEKLKSVRSEARETKKALEFLQAAQSGNYADAVALQRKIDIEVQASREKARLAKERAKQQQRLDAERARQIQAQAQRTSSIVTNLMGVAIASFSFKGLYDVAQDYIRLSNSLTLVANNGENVKQTLKDLYDVANEAKQPVEATAEAFITLKKNTQKLGISQKELLELSSTLSKAIAIGGSSADAAKNSMIQFGQALSLGKLSGQNFNSVAEQTPGLIQAIAVGLKMSAADLKNFANDGNLTTELIVKALKNANQQTADTFNKLGNTINGSFNILKNRFSELVGENDFFSEKVSSAILVVANNLKLIAASVGLATLAVVGFKTQQFVNYLSDMGKTAQTSSINIVTMKEAVLGLGKAFSLATIKEKALSAITVASTTLVGGLTIAWKAFNTVVKASVIGAILSAAVWAVEKLIDGIQWLYEKWKSWRNEINDVDQATYKTVEEHLAKLDEEIASNQLLLKSKKEQLAVLKAQSQFKYSGGLGGNSFGSESGKLREQEQEAKDLQAKIERLQKTREQVLAEQKQANLLKQKQIEPDSTPIVISKLADPNLQAYANTISNLKQQILTAKQGLANLQTQGQTTLSNIDQLNIKLASSVSGFQNLTKAQRNELISLNKQLDTIKENTAFTEQTKKLNEQNSLLNTQINLVGLDDEQRQQAIATYQLEQQIARATMGLSEQHAQIIAEKMRETFYLTQQLKEKQQEAQNSFLHMLDAQRPTWMSFKSMLANDISKLADAFADWATGGKTSFKDMTKSMLKDFVALTIKAAAFTATLEVGNALTGGALTTFIKTYGSVSKMLGFASGGYTGNIPTHKVAGVVHGGEFVLNNQATNYYGRDLLEAMNSGKLSSSYFNTQQVNHNQAINSVARTNVVINNHANTNVSYHNDQQGNLVFEITERMRDIAVETYEFMRKGE